MRSPDIFDILLPVTFDFLPVKILQTERTVSQEASRDLISIVGCN